MSDSFDWPDSRGDWVKWAEEMDGFWLTPQHPDEKPTVVTMPGLKEEEYNATVSRLARAIERYWAHQRDWGPGGVRSEPDRSQRPYDWEGDL